jgi:HK97 family phage prohead protease
MRKHLIGSGRFIVRKLEEAREKGEDAIAVRAFDTEIKAIDGETRAFDFTISTGSVDRYGDTVKVDGWKLANFRKNPVVLWMHDGTKLPVGKASNIRIEDGKLKARVDFTPQGLASFNDIVFELVKTGFLSATSVGFLPLVYNFVNDPQRQFGIDFKEQELLEFSIVTVPANAEALIEGRSAEIVPVEPQANDEAMSLDLAEHRIRALKLRAA